MSSPLFIAAFLLCAIFHFTGCTVERTVVKAAHDTLPSPSRIVSDTAKFNRLAPTSESGKYGFSALALLENGAVWSVGFDVEKRRALGASGSKLTVRTFNPEPLGLNSIYFVDGQHGWAAGYGSFFSTSDGGENWKKTDLKRNLNWTKIHFLNEETGYIAAKLDIRGEEAGEIWMTKDGGENWTKSFEDKQLTTPFSVLAVSESTALALFDSDSLLRTDDGGKTWKKDSSYQTIATSPYLNELYLDKSGRLWAVGKNGNFFYSVDKGRTWTRPSGFTEKESATNWHSIAFVDSQIGFAVGEKGTSVVTRDGGMTWNALAAGTNESLTKVYVNKDMGLVLGTDNLYELRF